MKRGVLSLVAMLVVAGLVATGCAQSAPAPAPTKAPAAPAKAAEPTKAPAAAPAKAAEPTKAPAAAPTKAAAAPATKVDFPAKGKAITMIIPFDAGGGTDVSARLLAAEMEKDLGVPVQVLNKPGAGTQVGHTELARAKPDGYTIGYTVLPTVITTYLDPERQAVFNRKSFELIAMHVIDSTVVAVKGDSPIKTIKDLVDAAKTSSKKLRNGHTATLGPNHLGMLQFQQAAGVEFAHVQLASGAELVSSLLGGHIDVSAQQVGGVLGQVKAGQIRVIGVMDKEESPYLPGVPTFEKAGYPYYWGSIRGLSAPAGTPKEIIQVLTTSIKKSMENPEMKKKMDDAGQPLRYMTPEEYAKFWDGMEPGVKPLMELGKK